MAHAATLDALDNSPVSDAFIRDPYPTLDRLRELDPVHSSDAIGEWVITGYDDVLTTMKDTASYSNEGATGARSAAPARRCYLSPSRAVAAKETI